MENNRAQWKVDAADPAFSGEATIGRYDEHAAHVFVFVPDENVIVLYANRGDSDFAELDNIRCRWLEHDVRKCVALMACEHDLPDTSGLVKCFNLSFKNHMAKSFSMATQCLSRDEGPSVDED